MEPVSPALASGFSTTEPPGKPSGWILRILSFVLKSAHTQKNPFPGLLVELSLDLFPGITIKHVDQTRGDQAWETLKPEVVGMTGDDSAARA